MTLNLLAVAIAGLLLAGTASAMEYVVTITCVNGDVYPISFGDTISPPLGVFLDPGTGQVWGSGWLQGGALAGYCAEQGGVGSTVANWTPSSLPEYSVDLPPANTSGALR